jgi:hypothetical protein
VKQKSRPKRSRGRPRKPILNFDIGFGIINAANRLMRESGVPFRECLRHEVRRFYRKEERERVVRRLEERAQALARLPVTRIVWANGKNTIIPPEAPAAPGQSHKK